jgi:hypothetical protein
MVSRFGSRKICYAEPGKDRARVPDRLPFCQSAAARSENPVRCEYVLRGRRSFDRKAATSEAGGTRFVLASLQGVLEVVVPLFMRIKPACCLFGNGHLSANGMNRSQQASHRRSKSRGPEQPTTTVLFPKEATDNCLWATANSYIWRVNRAQAGKEANWAPTRADGRFEVLGRLYGPRSRFYTKR